MPTQVATPAAASHPPQQARLGHDARQCYLTPRHKANCNAALEAAICAQDLELFVIALNTYAEHGSSDVVAAARAMRQQLRHSPKKQPRKMKKTRVQGASLPAQDTVAAKGALPGSVEEDVAEVARC